MSFELKLHNDINEIPLLGEWVEQVGEQMNLKASDVFQINLALEEAVVNVMNYAYPDQKDMPIMLNVKKADNQLVFHLIDNGISFNPLNAEKPDINATIDDRQIGGLGVFLVRQIMSTVEYQRKNDRNILTMTYITVL